MPGNYPEESIQHSEHSESLESSHLVLFSKVGIFSYQVPTSLFQVGCVESTLPNKLLKLLSRCSCSPRLDLVLSTEHFPLKHCCS